MRVIWGQFYAYNIITDIFPVSTQKDIKDNIIQLNYWIWKKLYQFCLIKYKYLYFNLPHLSISLFLGEFCQLPLIKQNNYDIANKKMCHSNCNHPPNTHNQVEKTYCEVAHSYPVLINKLISSA